MKTKILSVILSAIILLTSAAILVGCGDEKESVAKIATSDGAATKIETVTEVATDEQGSTQIVEETRVIEETTATNSKSESSESSETKSNDSSASKNNTNSANVKSNSNSSSANKTTNNTNSNKSSAKVTGGSTKPAKSSKPKSVAVTSVSLSKSSLSVTVGKSSSFTVTINPSNATNKDYTASTNNGNATVSCSGSKVTVKGISKGSCTVTVKSNNGKTAKCSVTVKAKTSSKPAKATVSKSKDAQARVIAQKIADASYKIAHKKNSNPSDLELVSIACELVSEYCNACEYTTSDPDYSTAYGVFIKRVYTCAGSVRALGMVLDCMGYSWKHVNENQWTHQWCELTMDGKKGWADAYNGYNFGELAIGAGYGDYVYDTSFDGICEHFGWNETTEVSGSEESGKIVYKLTTWKAYYGLGDEELIAYYDSNGNYIKKQQKINGTLYYEYNVTTGKTTYFKSTVDFL